MPDGTAKHAEAEEHLARFALGPGRSCMSYSFSPEGPFSEKELPETVFDSLYALFAPGKHSKYKCVEVRHAYDDANSNYSGYWRDYLRQVWRILFHDLWRPMVGLHYQA